MPKQEPATRTLTFWQSTSYFALPVVTWLVVCLCIAFPASFRLGPWLSFPLGFMLGTGAFAVWIYAQGGGSTVVELNVGSAILLILVLILAPVFIKARHQVRTRRHHHVPSAPRSSMIWVRKSGASAVAATQTICH